MCPLTSATRRPAAQFRSSKVGTTAVPRCRSYGLAQRSLRNHFLRPKAVFPSARVPLGDILPAEPELSRFVWAPGRMTSRNRRRTSSTVPVSTGRPPSMSGSPSRRFDVSPSSTPLPRRLCRGQSVDHQIRPCLPNRKMRGILCTARQALAATNSTTAGATRGGRRTAPRKASRALTSRAPQRLVGLAHEPESAMRPMHRPWPLDRQDPRPGRKTCRRTSLAVPFGPCRLHSAAGTSGETTDEGWASPPEGANLAARQRDLGHRKRKRSRPVPPLVHHRHSSFRGLSVRPPVYRRQRQAAADLSNDEKPRTRHATPAAVPVAARPAQASSSIGRKHRRLAR